MWERHYSRDRGVDGVKNRLRRLKAVRRESARPSHFSSSTPFFAVLIMLWWSRTPTMPTGWCRWQTPAQAHLTLRGSGRIMLLMPVWKCGLVGLRLSEEGSMKGLKQDE